MVANDDGGGIFETLEVGQEGLRGSFEQAFGTPHEADIESLVHGYGADYRRAETPQELLDVLAELKEYSAGVTVVEARTTRETRRGLNAAIRSHAGE